MTDTVAAAFSIAGRPIGPGHPVYIIAELSANHGHDEQVAIDLVRAAAAAGADAVKLQTYTPDTITIDSDAPPFRTGSESLWSGSTLYELYKEGTMPWEWQPRLKTLAESLGMDCFASPFDPTAVDFLVAMDVPAFKVASFELVDLPLIRRMASTGTAADHVDRDGHGGRDRRGDRRGARGWGDARSRCSSARAPTRRRPEDVNLRAIDAMATRWGLPVGLSDHTIGTTVPVAAVALGACIVEKHMTLSADDTTLDATFSLDRDAFREMVDAVRVDRAGARWDPHRPDRFRGREPPVPAIAVRRGGHRRRRAAHRAQRPLDPAGRWAAHPPLRGGPGSSGGPPDRARNPVGLRLARRSRGSAGRLAHAVAAQRTLNSGLSGSQWSRSSRSPWSIAARRIGSTSS